MIQEYQIGKYYRPKDCSDSDGRQARHLDAYGWIGERIGIEPYELCAVVQLRSGQELLPLGLWFDVDSFDIGLSLCC